MVYVKKYINIEFIKKHVVSIFLGVFIVCLVIFSSSNLIAAKFGMMLWATSIVPSIFPFFVATELISNTQFPYVLGRMFNSFMKPLFNVEGKGAFALIFGILCGYPMGAKLACNFRKQHTLSKTECERLLSFTNNSGPMFILGTVGISMYGNSTIGILLLIVHILSCLIVGFIFRFWKKDKKCYNSYFIKKKQTNYFNNINISNLGEVLSNSISSSISNIMIIGGFVIMFSVIISIFKSSKLLNLFTLIFSPIFNFINIPSSFIAPLLTGFLEITNGISLITSISIKTISINIILTSFLLGLGGFSVFLQVLSIVSKTDLSIKPYIYGKLLHGIISAFLSFWLLKLFPFLNFNL